MTTSVTREQIVILQRQLQDALAAKTKAEADATVLRSILGGDRPLASDVTALLNYGVQCKRLQAQFLDQIAQLRAIDNVTEARAIGNSMDALFRSAPVPEVLASR
jgi:hypothetical protein